MKPSVPAKMIVKDTEGIVPMGKLEDARFALKRYGLLGTVGRYLLMRDGFRRFIAGGRSVGGRSARRSLLRQFNLIQKHVRCAHSPYQFVLLAAYLLELDVSGPIVQCGAYKGGSSAKLSLLAHLTGRKLIVCDSFAGLPETAEKDDLYQKGHADMPDYLFHPGEYSGTLSEVEDNIRRWGTPDVCEFIPGLFCDTLPGLDVWPAFVFTDVDYVSSIRDCLLHLWPRLQPGGLWFTHEAGLVTYVQGMMDAEWWLKNLSEPPPVLYGAGAGLSILAPAVAYLRKPIQNGSGS